MNILENVTSRGLTDEVRELIDALDTHRFALEKALQYTGGTHSFDDIVYGVLTGRYKMWELPHSIAITEIVVYPRAKVLNVFLAGGDLQEILALNDRFNDFAKEHECSSVYLSGRKGWVKALKPLGWQEDFTVCSRKVQ